VAGAYAGVRAVADDIRKLLKKLAQLGDGRVFVDGATAEVLPVDAIADEASVQDIEVLSTTSLRGIDPYERERAYLIALSVNGDRCLVVVASNGAVLGSTLGLREGVARPAALDQPPPEPPPTFAVPEGASPDGSWVEGADGGWTYVDSGPYEYPDDDEVAAAKRRVEAFEKTPGKYAPDRPKRRPKAN
jgi:hypothetical protein